MSAGVWPGTRSAFASMLPIMNVSPSLKRWSNWLPSGRKLRSRLKIFLKVACTSRMFSPMAMRPPTLSCR